MDKETMKNWVFDDEDGVIQALFRR